MRSINKVILVGNLTRDPEMKRTMNSQNVTTFGLATNREWMTKDGRSQKSSEFHEVVCWGKLAEIANQYLKKGRLVYIEGYLKTRSWDDAAGVKKFRTEIVAEDLIMLEKRPKPEGEGTAGSSMETDMAGHEPFEESQASISMEEPPTL